MNEAPLPKFQLHIQLGQIIMATQDDVIAALKETLKRTGTLDECRAILRADIYHCLQDSLKNELESRIEAKHPKPPQENVLINEVIADYLAFNGYLNTLSVLAAETGTPSLAEVHSNAKASMMLGPDFIRAELSLSKSSGISAGRRRKPLAILYDIVESLKSRNISRTKTS